jgi:hypothetical protein
VDPRQGRTSSGKGATTKWTTFYLADIWNRCLDDIRAPDRLAANNIRQEHRVESCYAVAAVSHDAVVSSPFLCLVLRYLCKSVILFSFVVRCQSVVAEPTDFQQTEVKEWQKSGVK